MLTTDAKELLRMPALPILAIRLIPNRRCEACGTIGYVEEKNSICCRCFGAILIRASGPRREKRA
jgi:hypothetical protein